jgi:hypothetical protein
MIAFKFPEVKELPSFSIDSPLRSLRFHGSGLSNSSRRWEKTKKFGSCPLRCKTLVFPGFFAFLGSFFGVL